MPAVFGDPPFTEMRVDQDEPIDAEQLSRLLDESDGSVSLCLRSSQGPDLRGGYFFHVRRTGDGNVELVDFSATRVASFGHDELAAFINHCSGRRFDEASLLRCQREINFRFDPE